MISLGEAQLRTMDDQVDAELESEREQECGNRVRPGGNSGWHVCVYPPGHAGVCSWAKEAA